MEISAYYKYKNKYFDIPIESIDAIPNYTPGSESFRIYFSYDVNQNGFPDRPTGADYYQIYKALFTGKPSLKAEWFPAVGSKIRFANGSYIECTNYYGSGTPAASPTLFNHTILALVKMVNPARQDVTYAVGNYIRIYGDMSSRNDDSGAVYNPPASNGGWVYARMDYESWGAYLADLQDSTVSYIKTALYRTIPYNKVLFGTLSRYYLPKDGDNPISAIAAPDRDSYKSRLYNFFNGLQTTGGTLKTGFENDTSKPQGGNGEFDDIDSSDDVPIYNPTEAVGVLSVGGVKTHVLTNTSLPAFHDFMFSDAFNNTWDSIRKSLGNPQECIIGFRAIYAPIPQSTSSEITLGNILTSVIAPEVKVSFLQLDCGSVSIPEIWGNFLDYDPYTNISLYLPYCSTVQLPANEVVGGTLSVKYNVDLLTGACVAEIYSTKTDKYGTSSGVISRVSGNCAINVPWSMVDASRQWQAIMGAVTTVGAAAVTGGASAAAGAAALDATKDALKAAKTASIAASNVSDVVTNTSSVISNIPTIYHQNVIRGGNASSNIGVLQHPKPYLTITRPIQSLAENYGHYYGYPSNITKQLSSLSGFTKVAHINLESVPATSEELSLIQSALQSGVII